MCPYSWQVILWGVLESRHPFTLQRVVRAEVAVPLLSSPFALFDPFIIQCRLFLSISFIVEFRKGKARPSCK